MTNTAAAAAIIRDTAAEFDVLGVSLLHTEKDIDADPGMARDLDDYAPCWREFINAAQEWRTIRCAERRPGRYAVTTNAPVETDMFHADVERDAAGVVVSVNSGLASAQIMRWLRAGCTVSAPNCTPLP